ncbi:MAG: sorting signal type protein, partial [Bacteroidota bacterium]|nr:sorting signal type protein [Bacteroidota bacterium]
MKTKALMLIFILSLVAAKVTGQCSTALTSGSNDQTVCINADIISIVWTTDADSITSTEPYGLPAGVTATLVAGTTLTISGAASEGGSFSYTIGLSGPGDDDNCSVTGTIIVTPVVGTPSAPSGSTSVCQGSGTTDYTTTAANATSYTWTVTGTGNS